VISVVDYGVANLGSMLNMLRKVGVEAERVSTPKQLAVAKRIVLPGIGAFDQGMSALAERGLVEPLRRKVLAEGTPILGVCLGMQMLGVGSEEGELGGLGLVSATCRRFRPPTGSGLKVPHMGWSRITPRRASPLLAGIDAQSRFYFVHSYHVCCEDPDDALAVSSYGEEFVSVINRRNIFGVQFHPEKSHRFGMTVLRNFASLRC
jgi:imidazole glycerol-phosphate synthase subunit HisH